MTKLLPVHNKCISPGFDNAQIDPSNDKPVVSQTALDTTTFSTDRFNQVNPLLQHSRKKERQYMHPGTGRLSPGPGTIVNGNIARVVTQRAPTNKALQNAIDGHAGWREKNIHSQTPIASLVA